MELLKQPLCRPLSMAEQVVTLCTATNKLMVDIDKSKVKKFQMDMLEHFNTMHKDVMDKIEKDKVLTDELTAQILDIANAFKKTFQ